MLTSITVRHEGRRVLLFSGHVLIAEIPWRLADELAKAITAKARRAEEEEKGEAIAFDSAILLRAGVPFSFSNRLDILKLAVKEAAWNTRLRRYMPGGVKSKEAFGCPGVRRHDPKPKE